MLRMYGYVRVCYVCKVSRRIGCIRVCYVCKDMLEYVTYVTYVEHTIT